MRKFNQVITIEVSVDAIAEQLLSAMKDDYKHKELVTESIIGSSFSAGKLGFVYNALNGYTNEIDFKVGDVIYCKDDYYTYNEIVNGVPERLGGGKRIDIGIAEVIDVNEYADKKLQIRYIVLTHNRTGFSYEYNIVWVKHTECQKLADAMPSIDDLNASIKPKNEEGPVVGH